MFPPNNNNNHYNNILINKKQNLNLNLLNKTNAEEILEVNYLIKRKPQKYVSY